MWTGELEFVLQIRNQEHFSSGDLPNPSGHRNREEVSLEDVQSLTEMGAEDFERMPNSLYSILVQVMEGESFTEVRGVGNANGIVSEIHPVDPAAALTDIMRLITVKKPTDRDS